MYSITVENAFIFNNYSVYYYFKDAFSSREGGSGKNLHCKIQDIYDLLESCRRNHTVESTFNSMK